MVIVRKKDVGVQEAIKNTIKKNVKTTYSKNGSNQY